MNRRQQKKLNSMLEHKVHQLRADCCTFGGLAMDIWSVKDYARRGHMDVGVRWMRTFVGGMSDFVTPDDKWAWRIFKKYDYYISHKSPDRYLHHELYSRWFRNYPKRHPEDVKQLQAWYDKYPDGCVCRGVNKALE